MWLEFLITFLLAGVVFLLWRFIQIKEILGNLIESHNALYKSMVDISIIVAYKHDIREMVQEEVVRLSESIDRRMGDDS